MPIEVRRPGARFATICLLGAAQSRVRGWALGAALLLIGALFYLGRQPFAAGLFPTPYDGIAHLVVFATITFLLWLALFRAYPLLLVLLMALLGALDEGHQTFLPGRFPSFSDWLFDVLAAVLMVCFLAWMQQRLRRTTETLRAES